MFGIGVQELVVILVIVLVLFGGKKLPELSKSVGEVIRNIRNGFNDETNPDGKKPKQSEKK